MKIRNGFVTNSSSSSFIVAFPQIPESVEELQQMLFGDAPYYQGFGSQFQTEEIAKIVWNDMFDQDGNLNIVKIYEKTDLDDERNPLSGLYGTVLGVTLPDFDEFKIEGQQWEYDWEAYQKASAKAELEVLKRFKTKAPGAIILSFSYSDNEGKLGAALEHGGLFSRLEHLCISEH